MILALGALHCGGSDGSAGAPPKEVDLGFRPSPHGFGFSNYVNESGITNLTPVEMRRMFGDAACASLVGGKCELTPPARRWMNTTNAAMAGGHCHGLSLFALFAHRGTIKPADFGNASTFGLTRDSEALQREIAYWMATQFTPNQRTWLVQLTPAQVVERLRAAIESRQEPYSIGFYRRNGRGGHAVTPWAIRGEGANTRIMVYDNNIPGQEREIAVDLIANTWSYVASTNPSVPAARYDGDASSFNLILIPISSALGPQPCPFCGELGTLGAEAGRELRAEGAGALRIEDDQGHRIGREKGGAVLNNFPGAGFANYLSADLWQDEHEPLYRIPAGRPLKITLSGSDLASASPDSEVSIIARGVEYSVQDIALDPGQDDVLTLAADNGSLTYRTSGMETPVLAMGFTAPGADYEFGVRVQGDAAGQELGMSLRAAEGVLEVVINDNNGTTYDLEADRIAPDGAPEFFTHFSLRAEGTVRLRIRYGEWRGNGTPLLVDVDLGNDGTIDRTDTITDTDEPPFDP